jgi:hypothetical protein
VHAQICVQGSAATAGLLCMLGAVIISLLPKIQGVLYVPCQNYSKVITSINNMPHGKILFNMRSTHLGLE